MTASDSSQYVTPATFDETLAGLESLPGDPRLGFFGPASITWRVNRESAIFLGAGRAALLQLAHPWVAASLLHHSSLMRDAIGRFHSTFRVIYTMLFGTRAQAIAASRQLYQLHTRIRGELPYSIGSHPRGEHYEANEVNALCWVYATLVDSAVLAYEFVFPPLSPAELEQYYLESKRMAALFALPPKALPSDWPSFIHYIAAMIESQSLAVDENARALGRSILSGAGTWIRPPRWYRALTAYWMPSRLRKEFALTFGPPEERSVRRTARRLPSIYRLLPHAVRYVGPFHEAESRLRGNPPGPLTQSNNRFWMGCPRLLFPQFSESSD